MPKAKARKNKKPQRERFIEAAREFGHDEDPEAFERAFGKIVPPKRPKPERQKPDVARHSDPSKSD